MNFKFSTLYAEFLVTMVISQNEQVHITGIDFHLGGT
jgi:hypothetical protein